MTHKIEISSPCESHQIRLEYQMTGETLKQECWAPPKTPRINIGHLSTIPSSGIRPPFEGGIRPTGVRLPAFLEDDPVILSKIPGHHPEDDPTILSKIPDPIGNKRHIIYTLEPSVQDIITPEDEQPSCCMRFFIILTSVLCSAIIISTVIMLIVYLTKK